VSLVLLATLALGCAHPVQRRDWSGYTGPGAAYFQREELSPPRVSDPLEPLNRGTSIVNHALIVGVGDPVGRVYRLLIPRFARERLRDFAANLVFPRNLAANLLQGRLRRAGTETVRFAVNTTVGVAGFWDPAQRWLGIEPAPEDFGQVFARWGWEPSTFFVLPVFGPSKLRDAVGVVPDSMLDPASYFFPAGPVLSFNDQVDSIPEYLRFTRSSFDPYDDGQLLWVVARDEAIHDDEPVDPAGDDTAAVQTLEAAFLGPKDPGFAGRLERREVWLHERGRALPYSYRMQRERAPLVFLVPGLGAHRLSAASVALAEMVWDRGFSVAIVSNPLNFEFVERAASVPVPGHAPIDARDLHRALDAVARDLDERHGSRIGSRAFFGYSLGAFHGFFIAASEGPGTGLVSFDRYVLVDPPVRLLEGMERLDGFFNGPMALPPDQRVPEVKRILRKAARVGRKLLAERNAAESAARLDVADLGGATLTPTSEVPFTNEEAEFLIGLAFRRSLQELLYASQEREDLGVLLTQRTPMRRRSAYVEIGDYSFTEYLYAFVLPYHRDRLHDVATSEELVAANDLHAIEAPLTANAKLRVFANRNDFLTSDDDVAWLTDRVGSERVRLFPTGGHLGNLHRPTVQAEIVESLADLLPASVDAPVNRR
jgi:ABC-type transporter lipoprotein component MlaA